jgi:glycosyltransferase involved in cell wall biosynthesis
MSQRPSLLFLSENAREDQGSRVYRCAAQAKQLLQAGLSAHVVYYEDAKKAELDAADILIFSRCRFDDRAVELVQQARRAGKLVCGDLDDRNFAPWDVDSTGYMRSRARPRSSVSARQAVIERDTLRLLPAFDVVTVSTPGIREELEALGVPAHVTPNTFDAERFPPVQRERERLARVLVMSGTPTHDADLRRIAPALGQFLAEHRDVECTFLGALSLAGPLRGLPNVKKRPLLPLAELYTFVAQFDLCLVPLEATLFNDCKSALKFLECGAVSVPILASPRREYRSVLRHAENGFLAGDDEQSWYDALCGIHSQPSQLQAVAKAAHRGVLAEHTVASRKTALADYFRGLYGARRSAGARKEVRS